MSTEFPSNPKAEVTRVICVSRSLVQGSVMTELFVARNRMCMPEIDLQVRAALLYSGGCFVLWVEGAEDAVQAFVKRAAADPRNERQIVIHRSQGEATLVEPLAVATVQGLDDDRAFERRVRRLQTDQDHGVHYRPADIWRSLVAPCRAMPQDRAVRFPHRHLALVSAEDNGPIDLLRKLAERFESRVCYQRFAGAKPNTTDVGLAYVDLHDGHGVCRIHLLSRRALGHAMVVQSLQGLGEIVMLMGTRPSAAIELSSAVVECARRMAPAPALSQISDDDAVTSRVYEHLLRAESDAGRPNPNVPRIRHLRETELESFLIACVIERKARMA